jgi:formate dehydrogenase iron-sulfur subunit
MTLIKFTEAEVGGKLKWLFFNDRCRHCEYPNCKPSCPLKAIKKKANGAVYINIDICDPIACMPPGALPSEKRPCQLGCPFKISDLGLGIPRWKYMKDGSLVGSKMKKCDFCYNRFSHPDLVSPPFVSTDGLTTSNKPACAVTCPPGAIKVGAADTMKKKANKRVTYLKANGYPNANVYPTQLSIPTHVIWVLLEDPSVYGIPAGVP